MTKRVRQQLEEGPILDGAFVEHYWRIARRPSKMAAWWLAAKVRKHGVSPTARVLDVGCGPGWLPRSLAERFPRMQVVALDASEPMIARAGRGAGAGGDARGRTGGLRGGIGRG